jgi:hypothetical protein
MREPTPRSTKGIRRRAIGLTSLTLQESARENGDYFVILHTADEPARDEWNAYVDAVIVPVRPMGGTLSIIVATDGGGPNAAQRQRLAKVITASPADAVCLEFMRAWVATIGSLFVVCAGHATACGRVGFEPTRVDGPDSSLPASGGQGGDDAHAPADSGHVYRDANAPVPDRSAPIIDAASDTPSATDAHADDARQPMDATRPPPDGPSRDGAPEGGSFACPGAKVWDLDFDSDPTLTDVNGDGVLDWVLRDASTFPIAELNGGVWRSETRVALDSRPLDDFDGRTVVDVRMRSVTLPGSPLGSVFWVNINENGPTFSALFVALALQTDGTQTLTLYGKTTPGVETPLATIPALPAALVDVHLDIDAPTLTVTLTVNGVDHGSHAIPPTGAPNDDHFATLLAWEGIAEFDALRIQRCPAP